MNVPQIIATLKERFPDKTIITLPNEQEATEIIVEVERRSQPGFSIAFAVIEQSAPHHHDKTHEIYQVEQGELHVHILGEAHVLRQGDTFSIAPAKEHWAEADPHNPAWLWVLAAPAWEASDHHLATP